MHCDIYVSISQSNTIDVIGAVSAWEPAIICVDTKPRALPSMARCIEIACIAIIVAPNTILCRKTMYQMNIWFVSNRKSRRKTKKVRAYQQLLIRRTWITHQQLRNLLGQKIRRKWATTMFFNILLANNAYGSHVVKTTHFMCALVWEMCKVSGHVHDASYRFEHHKVWPHIWAICTKVFKRISILINKCRSMWSIFYAAEMPQNIYDSVSFIHSQWFGLPVKTQYVTWSFSFRKKNAQQFLFRVQCDECLFHFTAVCRTNSTKEQHQKVLRIVCDPINGV